MRPRWSPSRQAAKDAVKRVVPVLNRVTERVGVRLQPVHYYSEVPDRAWLRAHRPTWARPLPLTGVAWDLDAQLAWVEKAIAGVFEESIEGGRKNLGDL